MATSGWGRGLRAFVNVAMLAVVGYLAWRSWHGVIAPASVVSPADSAAGTVPFRFVQPNESAIVLKAVINGRDTLDLILDTGATATCLDASVARDLALPPVRGAMAVSLGVGGSARTPLVRVDSLRVGATTARGLPVCTFDMAQMRQLDPAVRGLLGLNFLRNFALAVDFDRRVVRFAPAREPSSGRARVASPAGNR